MSELKWYGGHGFPKDMLRKAAEEMRQADPYSWEEIGHYENLLDTALRSIWPGIGPEEVTGITVSVA